MEIIYIVVEVAHSSLHILESLVRVVVACVDISTQCQLAHKMREIV